MALLHAIWVLATEPNAGPAWWGAVIALSPGLVFVGRLGLTAVARTRANLPFETLCAAVGAGLACWYYQLLPVLYAVGIGLGGLLLYQFWYSRLGRSPNKDLQPGAQLPPFRLRSINGEYYTPTQSGRPSLLMFVRGAWCPLCVAQIAEVAEGYQELQAKGVQVFVLAWQSQEQSVALAKRFSVPLIFCVDDNNALARELNLVHEDGTPAGIRGYEQDTFLPTVIMTDKTGRIIFADQTDNYRVRPDPRDYLRLLDENQV